MKEEDTFQPDPYDKLAFRTAYLIGKYIQENLTSGEHQELNDWVSASLDNQLLFEELTDEKNLKKWLKWKEQLPTEEMLQRVKDQIGFHPSVRPYRFRKMIPYTVAASILAIIITTILIYHKRTSTTGQHPPAQIVRDIAPGGNKAVLTLSDGSTVLLDSMKKGNLASQGYITITKSENGQIIYRSIKPGMKPIALGFNTLSTPHGGQFQVILPDGTKVWLNAASSLHYPTTFSGNERKVELTGEGYFEVTKDAANPFIVSAEGITVQVLGTHFNVNAYSDEPSRNVTLQEGSVKVDDAVVIKPGEEAKIDRHGTVSIAAADPETTLAWKEGIFNFRNTPIEDVMRQVARWYNAEISYENRPAEHFNVSISRSEPVSKLLHLLEQTGSVHFKIENKKITVMK